MIVNASNIKYNDVINTIEFLLDHYGGLGT